MSFGTKKSLMSGVYAPPNQVLVCSAAIGLVVNSQGQIFAEVGTSTTAAGATGLFVWAVALSFDALSVISRNKILKTARDGGVVFMLLTQRDLHTALKALELLI